MKKVRQALRHLRRRLARQVRDRATEVKKYRKTKRARHARNARKDSKRIHWLKHLIRKERRRKKRVEESHREGVDWAYGDISPEALKRAGKDFVVRYVSSDSSKSLSASEARRYSQAAIDLVVVFEDQGGAARNGYSEGFRNARWAYDAARHIGMPDDRPVYLAVDFDAAGEGVDVRPYFRGAADSIGKSRVGIYAGLATLRQVADAQIVDWFWQTYAWSHHQWDKRAHLRQWLIYLPENQIKVAGVPVDYDKSRRADFGQWKVS